MLTAQVMEGAFLFWGVRAGLPSPGMREADACWKRTLWLRLPQDLHKTPPVTNTLISAALVCSFPRAGGFPPPTGALSFCSEIFFASPNLSPNLTWSFCLSKEESRQNDTCFVYMFLTGGIPGTLG